MKFILIRHGQSEANVKKIVQGINFDTPLSELGKLQAKKLANRLKNEKIHKIYSSDFKRAKETAEAIIEHHDLEIIFDKRLREQDAGDFSGVFIQKGIKEFYKNLLEKKINILEICPPNGESFKVLTNRINNFLNELGDNDENIVIVAHGGAIRAILNIIDSRENSTKYFEDKTIKFENTGLTILNKSEGKIILETINSYEHLIDD